ncbi:MAG: tRNA (adenosine(37)-N6)-threonylcarbamoyltransferase complex ATPase subunit type 1 TsaE [Bacteroidia bacterium]|nr:tRNA (adenosine(37)-N6)-threonylcarbamoyltransferase complex ATPase subunit type 1 TsaE [Bacteroidia bacterium]
MKLTTIEITSLDELDVFAKDNLDLILENKVVLLSGDLGAGKTALVKAFGRAFQVEENVSSPTFSLINEYMGFYQNRSIPIYHVDLYRIESVDELEEIGFEEYLDQDAIIFIEWPEIAQPFIMDNALTIRIEIFDNSKRRLNLSNSSRQ